MREFALALMWYSKRKEELEKGVIPFVEPDSMAEDLAFNELFFINNQISTLVYGCKKMI